ncbi:hypothetical protein [Microvirga sp. Mcv34]|uniref:hypothetical protein n=1 Tax=Microvirga sp. Mcv34 TaxID=2926016 RepID=UPI0021C85187|nr:hypothetical protein [Microvirga sp. Mcv34]
MATQQTQTPAFDEGTAYNVKLKEPVFYRKAKLLPLPVHTMTGAALNEIVAEYGADVIDSATPQEG